MSNWATLRYTHLRSLYDSGKLSYKQFVLMTDPDACVYDIDDVVVDEDAWDAREITPL